MYTEPVTNLLSQWFGSGMVSAVASFSVITHFEPFQKGLLDSRDIVFFLSLMGFALFTTGVILRGHRAG